MNKENRLDVALFEKGVVSSRQKAKELIEAGKIKVNGKTVLKPSFIVTDSDEINADLSNRFVSRAGYKLEKALDEFKTDVKGKVCLDIGASTGGFTDCLLQRGAKKVYSLDCGQDQLDKSLVNNEKVIVCDNVNAKNIHKNDFSDVDFICMDVSFISATYVIPNISDVLKDNEQAVILIKPQFEQDSRLKLKNGVVRDKALQQKAIKKVIDSASENGLCVKNVTYSPIKGGKGNIEYIALFKKNSKSAEIDIKFIVEQANKNL